MDIDPEPRDPDPGRTISNGIVLAYWGLIVGLVVMAYLTGLDPWRVVALFFTSFVLLFLGDLYIQRLDVYGRLNELDPENSPAKRVRQAMARRDAETETED